MVNVGTFHRQKRVKHVRFNIVQHKNVRTAWMERYLNMYFGPTSFIAKNWPSVRVMFLCYVLVRPPQLPPAVSLPLCHCMSYGVSRLCCLRQILD